MEAQVTTAHPGGHGSTWRCLCIGKGMASTSGIALEWDSTGRARGWPVPRAKAEREDFLPFLGGDAGGYGTKGRSCWVAAPGHSNLHPIPGVLTPAPASALHTSNRRDGLKGNRFSRSHKVQQTSPNLIFETSLCL